jgi:hypothetical protein
LGGKGTRSLEVLKAATLLVAISGSGASCSHSSTLSVILAGVDNVGGAGRRCVLLNDGLSMMVNVELNQLVIQINLNRSTVKSCVYKYVIVLLVVQLREGEEEICTM